MTTQVLLRRAIALAACLLALGYAGCGVGSEAARPAEQSTPVSTFEMLNQYGEWMSLPVLGEVWRPHEAYGWQPYNNGRWIWTDRGWTWAGYEPYSWIVYHYGYWTFDNFQGWIWVPSYDWSPARVRWVANDAYIGWAPIPPPGVTLIEPDQDSQYRIWTMVPAQSFVRNDVGKYRTRSAPLGSGTRTIGDSRRGPDAQEVGRLANQTLNPVKLQTDRVRSGNRQLEKVKIPSSDQPVDQSGGSRSIQPTVLPPAGQQPSPQPVTPPAPQPGRKQERPIEKGPKQIQPTTPAPTGVQGRQPGVRTDTRGEIKKVEKKEEVKKQEVKKEKPKEVLPPKKGEKERGKERKEER